MRIRFRYIIIFFGVVTLVFIASYNKDDYTYTIIEWIGNRKDYLTAPVSEDLGSSCNPERLPESIAKLNEIYDSVQSLVMFLGYSQATDGLIGNILDAHSEVLMPQEYDIIGNWKMYKDKKLKDFGQQKYMLFFFMHYLSTFQSIFRNVANRPDQFWVWKSRIHHIDYSYVPKLWQGQIQGKLKIIGDSCGVDTSKNLASDRYNLSIFKDIQSVVGIPVKFLHIITSPLENIATIVRKRSLQMNNSNDVKSAMKEIFSLVNANQHIRQQYGSAVLDIHAVELFENPKKILTQVCSFLEITCNDHYLDRVKTHLEDLATRSSTITEWGKKEREVMELEMKKYSFLEPYIKRP